MDRFELLARFARTAAGAIVLLLVGLGMVAGSVAALAAGLADGDRDLHAYEAASRCPTAPQDPSDCLWAQPFTVSEVDPDPPGRHKPAFTVLKDAGGGTWRATYGNPGPVVENLEPGDRVTGTIWSGHLTEISADGASQPTSDAPADMLARSAVVAMILLPSGLVLTAASAWRLARRRAHRDLTPGQRATFVLAFWLMMTALLSPIPASLLPYDGEAGHAMLTAAIWLPIATLLIIRACVHTVRKRRDTP